MDSNLCGGAGHDSSSSFRVGAASKESEWRHVNQSIGGAGKRYCGETLERVAFEHNFLTRLILRSGVGLSIPLFGPALSLM
jgi:hypothetical protein